jgi:hypothetical protein
LLGEGIEARGSIVLLFAIVKRDDKAASGRLDRDLAACPVGVLWVCERRERCVCVWFLGLTCGKRGGRCERSRSMMEVFLTPPVRTRNTHLKCPAEGYLGYPNHMSCCFSFCGCWGKGFCDGHARTLDLPPPTPPFTALLLSLSLLLACLLFEFNTQTHSHKAQTRAMHTRQALPRLLAAACGCAETRGRLHFLAGCCILSYAQPCPQQPLDLISSSPTHTHSTAAHSHTVMRALRPGTGTSSSLTGSGCSTAHVVQRACSAVLPGSASSSSSSRVREPARRVWNPLVNSVIDALPSF